MIIRQFERAVSEVCAEMGMTDVKTQEVKELNQTVSLIVSIGIVGDYSGYCLFKFTSESSINFATSMMQFLGMEVPESDHAEMVPQAIAEVANQFCGRATMFLSDSGTDCNITPPTVVKGSTLEINMSQSHIESILSITGPFGAFGLFLDFKKNH